MCHAVTEAPQVQPFQSNAPDGTAADQQADLERVMPEETLCWRAVCIPGWMWRKVAVNEPVSSKLQLAGVCISLRQYAHAPLPAASLSDTAGSSSTEAEVQPAGTVTGTSLQQPDERSQEIFVRPTVTQTNLLPNISLTPASTHQPSAAFVTHTLLRQWGAEASITILPVGWTKDSEQSAGVPSRVIAPGQPWNLQTRGLARLNSIWESQEGSGDDGTPTSSSVKSLFHSNANGHPTAGHEQGSPGLLFTNRQNNPLCKLRYASMYKIS